MPKGALAEASWIFPCCSNNNGSQLEYSPRQRTGHCLINDQTDKIIKMRVEFHVNVVMLKLSIFVGFRKDIDIIKITFTFQFRCFFNSTHREQINDRNHKTCNTFKTCEII